MYSRVDVAAVRVSCQLRKQFYNTQNQRSKNLFIFNISLFYVFNNFITTNIMCVCIYIYIILARNTKLPDEGVLTPKHIAASYIYIYVII